MKHERSQRLERRRLDFGGEFETNFNFPIDANARVLQMLPPETP